MKPLKIPSFVWIIVGCIVVLMLGALAGWFFYLRGQQGSLTNSNAATGLGNSAPSFGGAAGSTQTDQAIASQAFGYNGTTASSSQLWEVDASPVAGMGFVATSTGEELYYVERGNGYVLSADPSSGDITRLTNTLLPKIYQALVANDGSIIERSIDADGNVTTFLGQISSASSSAQAAQDSSTTPDTLTGAYLQTGIQQIAMNPTSDALFYLVPASSGGVVGITQQWNGTKKSQVFSSTVGSWLPYFLSDGTMILLESPADGIPGYAYTVSAKGVLAPLLQNINGLTVLPKASSPFLVYGSSSGTALSLFGATTSAATLLPFATIADKCVWLPGQSEIVYCAVPDQAVPQDFLDNWYKGIVQTSDDWWEIDLSTGTTQRVYSPSADNRSLDVEDPVIDPSGTYIAFINASDQSLWMLRVTQ